MNILLIHLGTQCECFVASSIIKGLKKKYNKEEFLNIYCFTLWKNCEHIFRYNKNVKKTYHINKVPHEIQRMHFDLAINLDPYFTEDKFFAIDTTERKGFNFDEVGDKTYEYMYEDKKTRKNLFQMYFMLAGLKWHGEGYDFHYYPKSKAKKDTSGISVVNNNLKHYILGKLKLNLSEVCNLPHKKNLYNRIDELNKCQNIITDDFFTLNLALFLRKNVYFLETIPFNFPLELFGIGKVFKIPKKFVQ